jgi:hypothetical protein
MVPFWFSPVSLPVKTRNWNRCCDLHHSDLELTLEVQQPGPDILLQDNNGGLELSTLLSESLGNSVDVTLIDKSDSFMFGYSKLDVMFGHAKADAMRLPYRNFAKPACAC